MVHSLEVDVAQVAPVGRLPGVRPLVRRQVGPAAEHPGAVGALELQYGHQFCSI